MSDEQAQQHDPQLDAPEAFRQHLIDKAMSARLRHGLYIDADTILDMLEDRAVVRYPTSVVFDDCELAPGEFAYAKPMGFHPSDGFCLLIHPHFRPMPDIWPLLIAYHIPSINYGSIAQAEHAELYGATLLGLEVETYYRALCELADSMSPGGAEGGGGGESSSSCGCHH